MGERRDRNREAFYADPSDPRHGTTNGYGNLGCRCDWCCAANTDYHLIYMREHPEQREKAADANMRRLGVKRRAPYQERRDRWRDIEYDD